MSNRSTEPSTQVEGAQPMTRSWLRWGIPVGLAGVLVLGLGAYALSVDDARKAETASWMSTPAPLGAATLPEVSSACYELVGDVPSSSGGTAAASDTRQGSWEVDGGQITFAEQRGSWTYMLVEGPSVFSECLLHETALKSKDSSAGSAGTFTQEPPVAHATDPDKIAQTMSGGTSYPTKGLLPFTTKSLWLDYASGTVGSNVTSVTVHPTIGPDFEATVQGGRFAAWAPGKVGSNAPEASGVWTYTVKLMDGSEYEFKPNAESNS